MAKTLYGHRIGATVQEPDAPQAVKLVPDNKTLIALPFNNEHDEEIDPIRLKSLKDIFAHYEPSREIVFNSPDEDLEDEELNLKFNELKDFTKDGIVAQSKLLKELEDREDVYSRMLDVLQNNQKLQVILSNDEYKKEFVELLDALIEELNENE